MSIKCRSALMTVLMLGLVLSLSVAQEKPKQQKPRKDEKAQTALSVKLNISVTDSSGQRVNDVSEDRFRIFEDEVPQKVSSFQSVGKPSCFVLAIDTSASLRRHDLDSHRHRKTDS